MSDQPTLPTATAGAIVTPEAVRLDFQVAGLASRALSFALDFMLSCIALFVLIILVIAIAAGSSVAAIIVLLVGLITILVGYPVVLETRNNGRTVGRMATGTRVVTTEGSPVRFRHSTVRALLAIVELFATFGAIAVVVAIFSKRGQRLGDLTAGTMVIRERTSKLHAHPQWYAPPPGLETFVGTIDSSAVTGELYLALRDFLARAPELELESRNALAGKLAAATRPHVQSAVPPPMTDEAYVQCIAAAATNGPATASGYATSPAAAPPPPQFGTGVSSASRDFGTRPPAPTGMPDLPMTRPAPPTPSPSPSPVAAVQPPPPSRPGPPAEPAEFPVAPGPLAPPPPGEAPAPGGFTAPS